MSSSGAPTPPTPPAACRGVSACPMSQNATFQPETSATFPISSVPATFPSSSLLPTLPSSPPPSALSANPPSIPTFDRESCVAFVASHCLEARAIALEVKNTDTAFHTSVAHGAKPTASPVLLDYRVMLSEVLLYSDVMLRCIDPSQASDPNPNPNRWFLPKFEPVEKLPSSASLDNGIRGLDHAVGNVPELAQAVNYVQGFTGFHEFSEFTAEDVGDSSETGMNQMVLANNDETVLLPLCERVCGTKRKSQIQKEQGYSM